MPGSTIGKKMNLGYLGKISRDGDALVVNRVVSNEEDSLPIKFGSPVFLNDDNTTIAIPASFTTGYLDGKGSVEITILERNLI